MTRLPISHRSPTRTPAWSSVWSPILTSAPTLTLLTSLQLFPITQFGPTQQNGPIQTLAPIRAVGSITAQGCIPGATFTGRSKSCVNLAKTNLGRLTTIRLGVGTPSIPAGTTALTILPDSRTEASLGDRTKARSESPCAIAGWTIRVTETEASPRISPPIKSAISPKVFIRETNCVFPRGDQPKRRPSTRQITKLSHQRQVPFSNIAVDASAPVPLLSFSRLCSHQRMTLNLAISNWRLSSHWLAKYRISIPLSPRSHDCPRNSRCPRVRST